jgi:ABC-type phosphate transport system permease subunit
MIYLTETILLLIPTGALAGFFVSLFMYLYAKRKNKRVPGSYSERQMRNKGYILGVFSVIAGAMVVAIIALVILLYTAVAYM